jgi:hypothetical protein
MLLWISKLLMECLVFHKGSLRRGKCRGKAKALRDQGKSAGKRTGVIAGGDGIFDGGRMYECYRREEKPSSSTAMVPLAVELATFLRIMPPSLGPSHLHRVSASKSSG